ncbi:protein AATF isoform X2 [Cylas formicarius]|uniref:protein AATF isoform X2 n=1 Tax=Cylas formicarius TaxID=197179 RepID=UPI002958A57F|nr:protein AATF isoform X2 [Cylas formicarius]
MAKKRQKETLAEKIFSVLNTAPATFDPEDDPDGSAAKLVNSEDEHSGDEDALLNNFRKQNIDLLADVDNRYAGEKGSRRRFHGSDSDDQASEAEDKIVEENNEDTQDQYQIITSDASSVSEDELESTSSCKGPDEDTDSSCNENSEIESDIKNDNSFKHLSDIDASLQVQKGLSVRNQLRIWENLVEIRIKLQKCLLTANKMPNKVYFTNIKNDSGIEFTDNVNETKQALFGVMDKLLLLQKIMVKSYPETKRLCKHTAVSNENDEEIPSDTDEMSRSDESSSEDETDISPSKKRKLNEYERAISDFHSNYNEYRNTVIEKWNAKTKLSITKNKGQAPSVINQIEHAFTDKNKLIKRTQLKRGEYQVLGKADKEEVPRSFSESQEQTEIDDYDVEIFDDTDFYHQLLRELIEVKAADITDPIQLGRQWTHLQNLRSKVKRKIDTRATKGRKIRYTVHTKLVNFMAPVDNSISWTDEAKTELYNSLFGKKQHKPSET